ncbi:MarR family winged helix-turn-helix transcriptional regulator [Mycobacterium sp.]|uniref:MarR family winged helix-turn-helix transcriptional regulator n=1 Tax=Mycobacterium sp. TaxID=1785 RepID=UPI0031DACEB4
MTAPTDLAADLSSVLRRLRRQLRRSAGIGSPPGALSESHTELLWVVARRPGISVSMAAAELGLVANTASTLVSKLVDNGVVDRDVDPTDRRVCRLWPTAAAQQIVDASAAARRVLLAEVLGELEDDQIAALTGGLEVLDEMTRMLQKRRP